MANPQWKPPYQPPVPDPAILAFQRTPAPATVGAATLPASNNHVNHNIRETGIVEKILRSYGFIQCAERDARLFFHFSEYSANVEEMKISDPVEFQMSFDRKTGKPIAVAVVPLEPGSVSFEILGTEQLKGTVVQAATISGTKVPTTADGWGRVSCEQKGECFFIPFGTDDVESSQSPKLGEEVYFYVSTDKRNGNLRARKMSLVNPPMQEVFQGVVCSMKNLFGFIERADVVKEIFFHYSEYKDSMNDLELGDDVEFKITQRNGKEVATEIKKLPPGTVIFEDIALEKRRGKIQKTMKGPHGRRQSDPLAGRIVYETVNGPIEIPYGDKDQKGEHTLNPGDLVEFNIATDRRDNLQKAMNILLVLDTFKVNGETRERGVVQTIKDGFGFISCVDRESRVFFHFSELVNPDWRVRMQDEVEFTVIQDSSTPGRSVAIRISQLPKGTVSFETVNPQKYQGTIEKEPSGGKSPMKGKDTMPGIIMYDVKGVKQTIPYSAKATQGNYFKSGDKVEFQICESKRNNTKTAVYVQLLERAPSGPKMQGFIATLKENFGFIETAEHDREVFFHFSAYDGNPGELALGDEVEYTLSRKVNKVSAESLRKLPKGTVAPEEVAPEVLNGKIIRCMRIVNPDQEEYPGIVKIGSDDDENAETLTYGITSLADKHDFLQQGDVVKFQVATVRGTDQKRATRIAAVRNYIRAKVDSVKGQFGFLNYTVPEEGKKLFFHMTEVHDNAELHSGDEVEFVIVRNQRNGKFSACSLRRISEHQRPERLVSRLKSISEDGLPKVIVLRQPRGPDGTKGFKLDRTPSTTVQT